jgi:anhydro-N-acetylmuramic acid kinase
MPTRILKPVIETFLTERQKRRERRFHECLSKFEALKRATGEHSSAILGLMSGTSLDGLDMALCTFTRTGKKYGFEILKSHTFEYQDLWKQRLISVKDASGEKYFATNELYGRYIAEKVNLFLEGLPKPMAIASHGHTVFHQPQAGFTAQIGSGATIAAETGIPTICDFRSVDVALGGQGAPLVPIGDKLLFGEYPACLNLGGIANISFDKKGARVAFDVCAVNMLLNYLAESEGKAYDDGGKMARKGKVNEPILKSLNSLGFYSLEGAKSLGREWFERHVQPLFDNSPLPVEDKLATAVVHIAEVLSNTIQKYNLKSVLVSGGGAFNDFLIEQLKQKSSGEIVLPDKNVINFKEALIFAFLGYLRLEEKVNTLSSVTGAKRDSCGGAIYLPA